jgi:carbamoyltransferase
MPRDPEPVVSFRTLWACSNLAITQFLGFPKYGDEFKVMGLAPYGEPAFAEKIRQLIHVSDDGALCLDLSYFTHWSGGMTMTWNDGEPEIGTVFNSKLEQLLGPARRPDAPLDQRHEAIAASLQRVYEEAAFRSCVHYTRASPIRDCAWPADAR